MEKKHKLITKRIRMTIDYIIVYGVISLIMLYNVNSSSFGATYMRQWIGSAMVHGSDNNLLPIQCQAIILTDPGLLSIGPLWTNFSEILIKIQKSPFTKMPLKIVYAKWPPFCPGGDELNRYQELCTWLVLCFVLFCCHSVFVVLTHTLQGYFTGTGAINWGNHMIAPVDCPSASEVTLKIAIHYYLVCVKCVCLIETTVKPPI